MMGFLAALVLLTAVGGGAGFLAGNQLKQKLTAPPPPESAVVEPKIDKTEAVQFLQLPSIVTNLVGEKNWVRLEAAVVLSDTKAVAQGFASELSDDVIALIHSLSVQQIAGPAGFEHFREELQDRLALRSGGRVKQVTIQSMIIE